MKTVNRSTGQSTAEYAIVLGVVLAALVAMQVYVKRGVNARLKDASDSASEVVLDRLEIPVADRAKEQFQYEPYYASSTYTVDQTTGRKEVVGADAEGRGGTFEKQAVLETTTRTGNQTTGAVPVPE
ncbi:MAG: hypothetical protein Q8R91_07480 [Candidatus Omnitrophota bacterium]|nr:hypothetical protein [Candidatus Omnitrophota bacterium]